MKETITRQQLFDAGYRDDTIYGITLDDIVADVNEQEFMIRPWKYVEVFYMWMQTGEPKK